MRTCRSTERAWLKTSVEAAFWVHNRSPRRLDSEVADLELYPLGPAPVNPPEAPVDASKNCRIVPVWAKHENFDNRDQALESYGEALRLDLRHAPAHLQLGLMLLRSGDFSGARDHLLQAANLWIAAAGYYLGLIAWYEGDAGAAEVHYRSVPVGDTLWVSAQRGLACVALGRNDFTSAIEPLSAVKAEEGEKASLDNLLALTLREAGQTQEAIQIFKQVLSRDPLNLLVLRELSMLDAEQGQMYASKLQNLLEDDQQYILDLAALYLDAGLPADAKSILEEAVAAWDYPMLYYLGAYIYQHLDMPDSSAQWREKGQQGNPERVFPSRLWEIIALEQAIDQNPQDDKAKYYLGNFLYAHQRYEEAFLLWKQACEGLDDFDVIHRNLGLAYWQQKDLHAIEIRKALI
jgi:tetratricopeptide (TPR) repeat protein